MKKRLSLISSLALLVMLISPIRKAMCQTRTYSSVNLHLNPKAVSVDSAFILPRSNSLFLPTNLGKDSTGALFYYLTGNKFYGRFNTGVKAIASEDSVLARWDSTKVKGYLSTFRDTTQNKSTVTFSPSANVSDILGTGYAFTITGVADHMKLSITTGSTGITTSGTIGNLVISVPWNSTPVTVASASDVGTLSAPIGFNSTTSSTIIIFSSTTLIASRTYTFSLISKL